MDKYEYNIKLDEIKALIGKRDYAGAASICDTIEWKKVRSNNTLNMVADAYEATKQYDKAKNALLIAYERTPLGRQLAYRLTILSIKEKNFQEAEEFYEDFLEVSPRDPAKYLLKYQLAKARGTDIDVLIGILEKYAEEDIDERWQYELAMLYHRAGYREKCVTLCDEMILWFGEGRFVEKALELKMLYEPLTKTQQEKYDKQWDLKTNKGRNTQSAAAHSQEQPEEIVQPIDQPEVQMQVEETVQPVEQPEVQMQTEETVQPVDQPEVQMQPEETVQPVDQPEVQMQPEESVQPVDQPEVQMQPEETVQPVEQPEVQMQAEESVQPVDQPEVQMQVEETVQPVEQPEVQMQVEETVQPVEQPEVQMQVEETVQPVEQPEVQMQAEESVQPVDQPTVQLQVEEPEQEQLSLQVEEPEQEQLSLQVEEPEQEQLSLQVEEPEQEQLSLQVEEPEQEQVTLQVEEPEIEQVKLQVEQGDSVDVAEAVFREMQSVQSKAQMHEERETLEDTVVSEENVEQDENVVQKENTTPKETVVPQETEVPEETVVPEESVMSEVAMESEDIPEEKSEPDAKEQAMLEGATGELVMNLGNKIEANTMQDEYNRVNLQEEIAKSMASILGNLNVEPELEDVSKADDVNTENRVQNLLAEEIDSAPTKRIPVEEIEQVSGDTKRIPDISELKHQMHAMNAMSEPQETEADDQIEGQMSLEEVLAQFEKEPVAEQTAVTVDGEEAEEEPVSYYTRPIFGEEFTAGIQEALGEEASVLPQMNESDDTMEESVTPVAEDMVSEQYLAQMEPTGEISQVQHDAPVFDSNTFQTQPVQEDGVQEEVVQEAVVPEQMSEQQKVQEVPQVASQPIAEEENFESVASTFDDWFQAGTQEPTVQEQVPQEQPVKEQTAQEQMVQKKSVKFVPPVIEPETVEAQVPNDGQVSTGRTMDQTLHNSAQQMNRSSDLALERMQQKKQSKNGKAKKRIPEKKRGAFASFLEMKDMEEQIAQTLENIVYHSANDGTSSTNNVMIVGETKSGKTTLALELIKATNKDRSRSGRKVAKVKGTTLNKRGIKNVMAKLLGTDLIIEQAGSLMPQQVDELIQTLCAFTGNMLVILEDDKVAIDRLVDLHPQLANMFNNQIVIKEYDINEWVRIAKEYARKREYGVDEMGTLALYAKINDVYGKKKEIEKKDVQAIIDDAIKHSEKKNIGKLFEIVFSRKYKDSDLTMLREADFQ